MKSQAGWVDGTRDIAHSPAVTVPSENGGQSAVSYSKDRLLCVAIEVALIVAIFLAVAGFGGSEPLSWSISQDLIFLAAIGLVLRGRESRRNRSMLALLAMAAIAIWVLIQWIASRHGRIGLDPYAIRFRGLAFAAALSGFFVALRVSRDRAARNRLALSVIGLGAFESLYGLAQNPGGWQYIWAYRRIYYTGSATGTYINHNHFAGLLEMILPLTLALAFYHWSKGAHQRQARRSWGDLVAQFGHPEVLKSIVLVLLAVLIFVAIAFSLSRMGLVCAIFSLLVLGALAYATRRATRVNWKFLLASLVLGGAAAAWIGVGPVVEHFERLSQDESFSATNRTEGRLALWRDVIQLIGAHPVTRVGLGCFEFAFTRFQSSELTLIIDHAHNDYLELAAEIGIPAAAVVFSLIVMVLVRATRASLRIVSHRDRAVVVGSIAGACALLVHSTVDFNLYIPANALLFAVLLGVSYSVSAERLQ
jgi:O-Antigen ligase